MLLVRLMQKIERSSMVDIEDYIEGYYQRQFRNGRMLCGFDIKRKFTYLFNT